MSLVAKVNVRAHKDGAVIKFAPGDEIPNGAIPQHDLADLLQVGSVEDTAETTRAAAADAKAEKAAGAEFKAAKTAVKAAQASTQVKE